MVCAKGLTAFLAVRRGPCRASSPDMVRAVHQRTNSQRKKAKRKKDQAGR